MNNAPGKADGVQRGSGCRARWGVLPGHPFGTAPPYRPPDPSQGIFSKTQAPQTQSAYKKVNGEAFAGRAKLPPSRVSQKRRGSAEASPSRRNIPQTFRTRSQAKAPAIWSRNASTP